MSSEELQRVFHVDRHDLVPEYEVVTVHAATPYTSYKEDNIGPPNLSIIQKRDNFTTNSDSNKNISDIWSGLSDTSRNKNADQQLPYDPLEKFRRRPDNLDEIEETDGDDDNNNNNKHDKVMKLSAFGKDLELKLKKISGLFGKGIRMWETLSNASNVHGIEYRELPQVSNKQQTTTNNKHTNIHTYTSSRLRFTKKKKKSMLLTRFIIIIQLLINPFVKC